MKALVFIIRLNFTMRSIITTFICLSIASASIVHAENLDDIYRAATDKNPLLLGAEAQLKSKAEIANIQKGTLLPVIAASISYGLNDSNTTTKYPNGATVTSGLPPTSIFSPTLPDTTSSSDIMALNQQIGISQPLLNFYSWYSFKGTKKISEQAQLEFAKTQQGIIVSTVEQYLNILRAKENLASSLAEKTAIQQRLEQTKQRYNVGLAAITEVNEAQAAYDLTTVAHLANEGSLEVSYEILSVLTGKTHRDINDLSANYPVIPLVEDKDAWVKAALEHNLDLLQAKKTIEASEYVMKASRANHYPTLTAAATYTQTTSDGDIENDQSIYSFAADGVNVDSDAMAIGLNLTIPIYTGGATSASSRKAAYDHQAAIETLNGIQRSITQQIRALHIASLTKMQQVNALKQSIISSQSALDAIQAGYDVGTRNIVDVLTAQRNLYTAKRDYANARFDYIISIFELKRAAGTLSPADIDALNKWTIAEVTTQ
jgi:outer membrane protein